MLLETPLIPIPSPKVGPTGSPDRIPWCPSPHLQQPISLKPTANRLDNRTVPTHHPVRSSSLVGRQSDPLNGRTLEMASLISIRVLATLLEIKPVPVSAVFGVHPDLIAGIVTDTENDGGMIRMPAKLGIGKNGSITLSPPIRACSL